MGLFNSNKELQAANASLVEENEILKTKAAELEANNNELSEKLASAVAEKAELAEKLESAISEKAEADKVAEEAAEAAKKIIDEQPDKVAEESARQVASMGHEPVEQTEADDEVADVQLSVVDQYRAMAAGPERDKFFKENKRELFGALNK